MHRYSSFRTSFRRVQRLSVTLDGADQLLRLAEPAEQT
jgi:hypothetical protein